LEFDLEFVIIHDMNKVNLKDRVTALEAEVKLLRKKATGKPDFRIDDANWKKAESYLKRARMKTYKKVYG
jgi:hypothetical protein